MMRLSTSLILVLFLTAPALADCPPDCVPGGGPATTDCFVAWSGIPNTKPTCTDGDATCDTDGAADGVCTFALEGCINVAGLGSCTAGTLTGVPVVKPAKDAAGQALASALDALDPSTGGCTPPGYAVPLKVSAAGIKPGRSRITVTASSGGKKDKDKLTFTCSPSTTPRSLARDVQPIFGHDRNDVNGKCTYSGCHSGPSPGGNLNLEEGQALAQLVNVPATPPVKLLRVKPGSVKGSFLARKVLGEGIPRFGGSAMPQGCPAIIPPVTACLTDAERLTILYWIATGAAP